MNKPKTLADALAKVRGTPEADAPQPANLAEALALVHARRTASAPATKPASTAKAESLPGLRAFMREWHDGRR